DVERLQKPDQSQSARYQLNSKPVKISSLETSLGVHSLGVPELVKFEAIKEMSSSSVGLVMMNWNQITMCSNCESQFEPRQIDSEGSPLCPHCTLESPCKFECDENDTNVLHDSGFLDGESREAVDQQCASLSARSVICPKPLTTICSNCEEASLCTNCNLDDTWAAASDNNDTEVVTVIRIADKIIDKEMAARRKIEKERLETVQKADDRHWLVHQYGAPVQCTTDIRSVEILHQPEATIEGDCEWFRNSIAQSLIQTIPYSDIQDKDFAHPLGRGDSGSVYSAKWNHKMVAIKEFHNEATFWHEIRVIYTLSSHPNIVKVLAVTRNPTTEKFEMVMELASKGSLNDFWKISPNLPWPKRISIALELASGLQHAYKNDVLHGSLSCSNVLIREDCTVALSGFSKSRTRQYTLNSYQPSTVSSEIYSFGVILWELSACRSAFENALNPRVWDDFLEGTREVTMSDTPVEYRELYELCWSRSSSDWPDISDVEKRLNQLCARFHIADRDKNSSNTLTTRIIRRPYHFLIYIYWLAYRRILQSGFYGIAEIIQKIRNTAFSPFSKSSQVKHDSNLKAFEILEKLRCLIPRVCEIPNKDLKLKKYWHKRGNFADIHRGQWNGKEIAIKAQVIAPSNVIREVMILNRLTPAHHRNIVKFEGISTEYLTGRPYIVMEFASMTLEEFVGRFNYVNIRRWQRIKMCIGIAEGLAYMHGMQILHCDLHSANVLITPDRRPLQPLIAGFGLSRNFSDTTRESTVSETYPRIAYTAPELLDNNNKSLPFESSQDIFSLGVIIGEVLSGESPYDNYGRRINPNMNNPICGYPPELASLYQQCVSDNRSKRPDIGVVVRKLREIHRRIKPETLKLLLKLDENNADQMYIFDLPFDIRAINAKDLKNLAGASAENILEYAENEGRTFITTDMHFRFKQSSCGIVCLWGYFHGKPFGQINKNEKEKIFINLLHDHFGEIAKLQDTAQTKLGILRESFKWTLCCPFDDELDKLLPEMN
ncbi:kinase-like domain-containing protein, partial [Endogone sp. FLAS-F59071]